MSESRSIVLLGYRGSGKSTVGRALAERLDMAFMDTDALVLERFDGRTVADIWVHEGEPAFRAIEAEVVAQAVGCSGRVVALGGGAVTEHSAGRLAVERAEALRVYLAAPPSVLGARIAGDADTGDARPSLTGTASVTEEIAAVLAQREPVYRAVADVVVDVADATVEAIADQIVSHRTGE
ncbi:MAG: shikimate kinase [Planctomycetota bacterium]